MLEDGLSQGKVMQVGQSRASWTTEEDNVFLYVLLNYLAKLQGGHHIMSNCVKGSQLWERCRATTSLKGAKLTLGSWWCSVIPFPIVWDSLKIQMVLSHHRNGLWERLLHGGSFYLEMWKLHAFHRDCTILCNLAGAPSSQVLLVDMCRCTKNSGNSVVPCCLVVISF